MTLEVIRARQNFQHNRRGRKNPSALLFQLAFSKVLWDIKALDCEIAVKRPFYDTCRWKTVPETTRNVELEEHNYFAKNTALYHFSDYNNTVSHIVFWSMQSMKTRPLLIASVLCCALMLFQGKLYCKDGAVSAQQQQTLPVPSLFDCTVKCAHGYFAAYSGAPGVGDTTRLDLKKLMQSENRDGCVKFSPKIHAATDYIVVNVPLTLGIVQHNGSGSFSACRLETARPDKTTGKSNFDIHYVEGSKYLIYYTFEVDGIVQGLIVLDATKAE